MSEDSSTTSNENPSKQDIILKKQKLKISKLASELEFVKKDSAEQISKLKTEVSEFREAKEVLCKELDDAIRIKSELEVQLKEFNANHFEKFKNDDIDSPNVDQNDLRSRIEILEKEKFLNENEIARILDEKSALQAVISEFNEKYPPYSFEVPQKSDITNEELEESERSFNDHNNMLLRKLEEIVSEKDSISIEVSSLIADVQSLISRNNALNSENNVLQQMVSELSEQQKNVSNDIEKHQKNLEHKNSELIMLSEQVITLKESLEIEQEKSRSFEDLIKTFTDKFQELETTSAALVQDIVNSKRICSASDKHISFLECSNKELNNTIQELQKSVLERQRLDGTVQEDSIESRVINDLSTIEASLQTHFEGVRMENERLSETIIDKQDLVAHLVDEIKQLQEAHSVLEERFEVIRSEKQILTCRLTEVIECFETEKSTLTQDNERLTQDCLEKKQKISDLNRLLSEKENLLFDNSELISSLEIEKNSLSVKAEEVQCNSEKAFRSLNEEFASVKEHKELLVEQKDILYKQFLDLEEKLRNAEDNYAQVKMKCQNQDAEIEALSEFKILYARIQEEYEGTVEDKKATICKLQSDIAMQEETIACLEKERLDLQKKISDNKEFLENNNTDISNLNSKISKHQEFVQNILAHLKFISSNCGLAFNASLSDEAEMLDMVYSLLEKANGFVIEAKSKSEDLNKIEKMINCTVEENAEYLQLADRVELPHSVEVICKVFQESLDDLGRLRSANNSFEKDISSLNEKLLEYTENNAQLSVRINGLQNDFDTATMQLNKFKNSGFSTISDIEEKFDSERSDYKNTIKDFERLSNKYKSDNEVLTTEKLQCLEDNKILKQKLNTLEHDFENINGIYTEFKNAGYHSISCISDKLDGIQKEFELDKQNILNEAKERSSAIEDNYRLLDAENSELKTSLKALECNLSELQQESDISEKKKNELQNKLEAITSKHESEIYDLQSKYSKLREDYAITKEDLTQTSHDYKELIAVCDQLTTNHNEETNSHLNSLSECRNEISELQTQSAVHLETHSKEIENFQQKISFYDNMQSVIKEKVILLSRCLADSDICDITDDPICILDSVFSRVKSLNSTSLNVQTDLDNIQKLYNESQKSEQKLKSSLSENEKEVIELKEFIDSLQKKIDNLEKQNFNFENDKLSASAMSTELHEELSELRKELINSRNEYDSLKSKNQFDKKSLKELKIELDNQEAKSTELASKLNESASEYEKRIIELENLVREWSDKSARLQKQADDLSGYEELLSSLRMQLDVVSKENESLNSNVHSLEKEIVELKSSDQNNMASLVENGQTIKKLRAENQILLDETSRVNSLNETIDQLKMVSEELLDTKDKQQVSIKELEDKLAILNTENEELQNKLKESENKVQKLKQLAIKAKKESQQLKTKIPEQNEMLKLELQDAQRSLTSTSEKLINSEKTVVQLQTDLTEKSSTLDQKLTEFEDLQSKFTTAAEHSEKLSDKLVHLEHERDQHILSLENKEKELNIAYQSITSLKEETAGLSKEKGRLEEQLATSLASKDRSEASLNSQISTLSTELSEAKSEISTLQNEFDAYKVRAHSVLKQTKSQLITPQAHSQLKSQCESYQKSIEELKVKIESVDTNKAFLQSECDRIKQELQFSQDRQTRLTEDFKRKEASHKKMINELKSDLLDERRESSELHSNLKNEQSKLTQYYQDKITMMESESKERILELEKELETLSKLKQTSTASPPAQLFIPPIPFERPAVYGQEKVQSTPDSVEERLISPAKVEQVSFEQLLSTPAEIVSNVPVNNPVPTPVSSDDTILTEKKLHHLTELLNESETTIERLSDQNQFLKEEIRRLERNSEREKTAANMEYIKNVIIKFLMLSPGDERERLVTVIATILKLSQEERQFIIGFSKGETSGSSSYGWSGYLPRWSGLS